MTLITVDGQVKFDRQRAIRALIKRDGLKCQFPGCNLPFDPNPDDRHAISIDHIYPQVKANAEGWTFEQLWGLKNLQLMGRSCNARKSDLTYDEDGNLPIRGRTKAVRVARPDWCAYCDNGRELYPGEICPDCGSEPTPKNWPATMFKSSSLECDHWKYHCWMCGAGHIDRVPASADAFGIEPEEEANIR